MKKVKFTLETSTFPTYLVRVIRLGDFHSSRLLIRNHNFLINGHHVLRQKRPFGFYRVPRKWSHKETPDKTQWSGSMSESVFF